MFLKEIERKQREFARLHKAVNLDDALQFARTADEGKTIGVKVPADVRAKLDAIQKRHGLKTVKQAVLLTVFAGIQHLEVCDE